VKRIVVQNCELAGNEVKFYKREYWPSNGATELVGAELPAYDSNNTCVSSPMSFTLEDKHWYYYGAEDSAGTVVLGVAQAEGDPQGPTLVCVLPSPCQLAP
jgi:hypothetical protein